MSDEKLLEIMQSGFDPTTKNRKKVIVVGAGMAGLVAAYELKRAGHEVTILEAQDRIGGRVCTVREPFRDGFYGEAGAMRIPIQHTLTMCYIEKFGLETTIFHNSMENNFVHFNEQRHLLSDVEQDLSILGLDLISPEGKSSLELWDTTMQKFAQKLVDDSTYWNELIDTYGDYSTFDFLKELLWSRNAINDFGRFTFLEQLENVGFVDLLQIILSYRSDKVQIVGGMDSLPNAFLPELENDIQFNSEVVAMDYDESSVTIHYKRNNELTKLTGDFAIVTMPFSAMRFVDLLTPFSKGKQNAIRKLRYIEVSKVLLQFRRRFWEEDEGIYGGISSTDLPNGEICYPERPHYAPGGVLIGMYAAGTEAQRWAILRKDEAIEYTLKYVNKIHPGAIDEFEMGFVKEWGKDRFAGGLAVFNQGDKVNLHQHIISPEGRIHFAGEHASLHHGWIEGAVESGLRAAHEI